MHGLVVSLGLKARTVVPDLVADRVVHRILLILMPLCLIALVNEVNGLIRLDSLSLGPFASSVGDDEQ